MNQRAWFPLLPFLLAAPFLVVAASATTLLDPDPENSTTHFGQTIVALGDINGDGVPDLAVAAPFQDGDFVSTDTSYGKPQNVGKIFLVDGSTLSVLGEMNDPEFALIQLQHFGGQVGYSISTVADLDHDGIIDLIAGVPHHIDEPSSHQAKINSGKALVFSGKDGHLLFTLSSPDADEDDKMGTAVAGLGDVNADGTADLLVGVPGKDIGDEEDGLKNVGLAYVFSGATGQVIRTVNHPDEGGSEAGAAFGAAVANAGDIDADGVSDLLIGAPGQSRAYVFSGQTGSLLFTINSPASETLHSFGATVAGGKDFNRDGKPDFVIGAPLRDSLRGAAYIFNGSDGSLQQTLLPKKRQPFAKFGTSLAVSDDLTGDGRADIVVDAPGQNVNNLLHAGTITIFDGQRGRVFQTLTSAAPQAHGAFGTGMTTADFDSNGIATVVVGTPAQDAEIDSVPHLQIGQIEIQP